MTDLTTTGAAARLGVTQARIRQLIFAKKLPARKIGRDWLIQPSDLSKVAVRKAVRPRKG
jgi:excisionase family DNA binding protein